MLESIITRNTDRTRIKLTAVQQSEKKAFKDKNIH